MKANELRIGNLLECWYGDNYYFFHLRFFRFRQNDAQRYVATRLLPNIQK